MTYTRAELEDLETFRKRFAGDSRTEKEIYTLWVDARRSRRNKGLAKGYPPETWLMSREERTAHLAATPPAPTIGDVVAREATRLTDTYDPTNDAMFLRESVRAIEADLALKRERRLLADYQRQEAARNLFLEGVREAIRPIEYAPPMDDVLWPDAPDLPVREAVGLWSDLHAGKGTATFNESIARSRVAQVVARTIAAVEKERGEARVDTYHMLLLGDLCDGANIYPTQPYHSEQNVLNQIFRTAAPIVAEAIRDLRGHFRELHITCVPGNHGRVSKFHHEEDNADNYLYETVKLMTEHIPGVHWHMNHHWYTQYRVLDTMFLLTHGHQHKIAYSVPFYSLTRKALGWHATMPEQWDIECIGHFHVPSHINCNDINLVMNGAFVGDDEFALEVLASKCAPAQTMLIIDEHEGLTQRTVFTLQ